MTAYYRLLEDWQGLSEGSVITEEQHKGIFYLDKCLFERINEDEIKDMVKYEDESFCHKNGIEFLLFYTENELNQFLNKKFDAAIIE